MDKFEYGLIFTKGFQSYCFHKTETGEMCYMLDYSVNYDSPIKSKDEDTKKTYHYLKNLLKGHLPSLIAEGKFIHQLQKDYLYLNMHVIGISLNMYVHMLNPLGLKDFSNKFKDLTDMEFDEFLSLKGLTINSLKGTYKFLNNAIIGNTDKGIQKLKDLTYTHPDFDKKLFRMPVKMKVEYSPDMDNLELLKYLISSVSWESGQEKSLLTRYRLKRPLIMGSYNDFLPMYGFTVKDGEQFLNTVRCDCINDTISLTYILSSITSTDAIEHRTITIDKNMLDQLDPMFLEIFLNNLRYHYTTYLTHADNGYWEYKKHAKVEEVITGMWHDINGKRAGKREVSNIDPPDNGNETQSV